MSCGEPHETDCSEVLERLHEYLDHELDEVTVGKIQVHLTECGPCLSESELEGAIKALVARAAASRAPQHLRARIVRTLHEVRVGVD